ncbi:hypothetical protein MPSEU_000756400 [Mayamaea pseudoterrestris]|nr:hypothetical protein MPSEU_000756400 [Mayamaea pseudoterrestris]
MKLFVVATMKTAFVAATPFQLHWSLYPHSYTAQKIHDSIEIDGNIDKPVWRAAQWSEPFADITGESTTANEQHDYTPAMTKFKALYDDDYLYIAAVLEASPDFPTIAKFTERNSAIYQLDSDFEVFVDAFASHFDYKELELNAVNTVWNLMLDKPYRNGGCEHSGRVAVPGDANYYDVSDQVTETRVAEGILNDDVQGATWTVELKWSLCELQRRTGAVEQPHGNVVDSQINSSSNDSITAAQLAPTPGTFWRVNFSRVELQGAVNWTWQSQFVWDASSKSFRGMVDMHLPDAWGYFVFGNELNLHHDNDAMNNIVQAAEADTATTQASDLIDHYRDPFWPARLAAMNVYYALEYHMEQHQTYTNDLSQLQVHPDIVLIDELAVNILLSENETHFTVQVQIKETGLTVTVRDDRLLTMNREDAKPTEIM